MLFRRTAAAAAVVFHQPTSKVSLLFFATATTSNPPKAFAKIPWRYRSQAIQESQKALLDYLHTTRSLPFLYADYISRNSPQCLWAIVSKIPFSRSNFVCSLQRFLRYHPINELDFFFESIGWNCEKNRASRKNTFFISDWQHFDVVCALAGMGFPWRKLGLLCREDCPVFKVDPSELERRIGEMKDSYGFDGVSMISICLAFPHVLYSNADGLLGDLKILFLDDDLLSSVEGSVDAVLELCEKVKLFYNLGCEMGKVGELMGRSKCIFVEYSKEHLVCKIEYFCRLNVGRDRVGLSNGFKSLLEKKIDYFCTEMGSYLQYLDNFPGYLCYDLEKRIKPRYRFHKWLKEQGYSRKNYTLATILASSEKAFVARVSRMDCAAAKMWQESLRR